MRIFKGCVGEWYFLGEGFCFLLGFFFFGGGFVLFRFYFFFFNVCLPSTVSARDGSAAAADDDEEDEETGTSPFMESSFSECWIMLRMAEQATNNNTTPSSFSLLPAWLPASQWSQRYFKIIIIMMMIVTQTNATHTHTERERGKSKKKSLTKRPPPVSSVWLG